MEVAKVTSKGQITIPISIRRKLGINEGDKVLFIYKSDGVLMVNPNTFQGGDTADAPEPAAVAAAVPSAAAYEREPVAVIAPDESVASEEPAAVVPAVVVPATPPAEVAAERVTKPVPPPVDEPDKPDPHVGGFNLNTLLDDIRSIGSNI